uniref:FAD synthase n=2 Tax=Kalanchoe fedtschenkoi TaxID=63787 RepID=A0A7N0RGL5_KALFE
MEIDKAVRESGDRRLQRKYETAVFVIQRALVLYSIKEVAFSFNGGKDSTVLLHLLRAGYYLHEQEQGMISDGTAEDGPTFPIRTIYFESPSAFPEINSFTYETASKYGLKLDIIRLDFKSGLEALLKSEPIRAIFLGVRNGDPTAVGQEQFSPSSPGWPPFMRVNPILDWSYRDVWAFLLTCKVPYCSLYDKGYTSIGSIYDTVPNTLLCTGSSAEGEEHFKPAHRLLDGRMERAGRVKKIVPPVSSCFNTISNGVNSEDEHQHSTPVASIISVGDEILSGTAVDYLGPLLFRKLHEIGWVVSRSVAVQSDIDSVADEVERRKVDADMVFVYGGVGPLHSDVTLAGVAKAFGVRMAPHDAFNEYYMSLQGEQCTSNKDEKVQLPEGITELLHHEKLSVPLLKFQNVIVFSSSNVTELEEQWDCLLELSKSIGPLKVSEPFVYKHLATNLRDVEISKHLSKLSLQFPDIYVGGFRKSRSGPLVVNLEGKDPMRIELAAEALCKNFHPGAFTTII